MLVGVGTSTCVFGGSIGDLLHGDVDGVGLVPAADDGDVVVDDNAGVGPCVEDLAHPFAEHQLGGELVHVCGRVHVITSAHTHEQMVQVRRPPRAMVMV